MTRILGCATVRDKSVMKSTPRYVQRCCGNGQWVDFAIWKLVWSFGGAVGPWVASAHWGVYWVFKIAVLCPRNKSGAWRAPWQRWLRVILRVEFTDRGSTELTAWVDKARRVQVPQISPQDHGDVTMYQH